MKHKGLELEHEDIVTILSDALYGSHELMVDYPEESRELWKEICSKFSYEERDNVTFEDKLALILEHGGKIYLVDMLSEELLDNWEAMGDIGNAVGCIEPELDWFSQLLADKMKEQRRKEGIDVDNEPKYGCVVYAIGLEDLNRAVNTKDGLYYANQIINEEDDFYTGYNILQIAMFGEVVYG